MIELHGTYIITGESINKQSGGSMWKEWTSANSKIPLEI
jgi:hypothetical protein